MREERIAYFISPHGFGHASRACAIIEAVHEINPSIRFELFTEVPRWFFEQSLPAPFGYHSILTDIGFIQDSPLLINLPKTLDRLREFFPFDERLIESLSGQVNQLGCKLILCDIAPMGIAVGRRASVPSILIENFTWDWIYEGYVEEDARIGEFVPYLRSLFRSADYHVQMEPFCVDVNADLIVSPISRPVRTPGSVVRERLGIATDRKVLMITMGGIPTEHTFLNQLERHQDITFVIPGLVQSKETRGNLILLPHLSDFFHPDLVNASDALVGKLGYSTLAEVYHAGVPYGYVTRPGWREAEVLMAYIREEMRGLKFTDEEFEDGSWLSRLDDLIALPRIERTRPNGASEAAEFIHKLT